MGTVLPPIPAKRYFTIGEVADLCGVKPHVLRYWEQEFTQLRPMKRRGNRRYYQHHEVLMIRRIRDLLYDQGFTISGARNRLQEWVQSGRSLADFDASVQVVGSALPTVEPITPTQPLEGVGDMQPPVAVPERLWTQDEVRRELLEIRSLLSVA
ncbi:MerR family transcriptional regulator [Acidovorax lacteus]